MCVHAVDLVRCTGTDGDAVCPSCTAVVDFQDAKKLPQQYEMTMVCKTCYLIYHTIDGERFQATRSTSRAAARLYNAKILSSHESTMADALAPRATTMAQSRRTSPQRTRAWEISDDRDSG